MNFGDNEGSHGRNVGVITSISIHHDAAPRPHDYDSVARYVAEAAGDTARLGPGLPYHFRIDNVGTIFLCRPLTTWLNCVGSPENVTTIAICLDGYFQSPYNEKPTLEQCEAHFQLIKSLSEDHPEFPATWPDVRPHRDFSSTSCPGDNLAPYIFAIKDEATALQFPANDGYDWPSLQPNAPVVASPPPTPPSPIVPTPAPLPVPPPQPDPTPAPSPIINTPKLDSLSANPTPVEPVEKPVVAPPIPTPIQTSLWDWIVGLYNIASKFLKSFKRSK